MTDHFQEIYANRAADYEAMVKREDYRGVLPAVLQKIKPFDGIDVVEFGAGTGRLTLMLAPRVRSIRAYDASQHMLDVTIAKLQKTGLSNWRVEAADNRAIPADDTSADLAIEGWSFGHFTGWYPDTWREEAGKALAEMQRVLRPGGTAILLETMGTGRETPMPPSPGLTDFYSWLEIEQGFSATWFRTDYRFASLEEAERLTRFFFGDDLAITVKAKNWVILPECTGIWWKNLPR